MASQDYSKLFAESEVAATLLRKKMWVQNLELEAAKIILRGGQDRAEARSPSRPEGENGEFKLLKDRPDISSNFQDRPAPSAG
jgi:hypothetical protein